jgi:UMF1 family MFS transporter
MVGKFGAILGPVLMGWVSIATGHPRYSILSVVALFVSGAIILCLVRQENTGE